MFHVMIRDQMESIPHVSSRLVTRAFFLIGWSSSWLIHVNAFSNWNSKNNSQFCHRHLFSWITCFNQLCSFPHSSLTTSDWSSCSHFTIINKPTNIQHHVDWCDASKVDFCGEFIELGFFCLLPNFFECPVPSGCYSIVKKHWKGKILDYGGSWVNCVWSETVLRSIENSEGLHHVDKDMGANLETGNKAAWWWARGRISDQKWQYRTTTSEDRKFSHYYNV